MYADPPPCPEAVALGPAPGTTEVIKGMVGVGLTTIEDEAVDAADVPVALVAVIVNV